MDILGPSSSPPSLFEVPISDISGPCLPLVIPADKRGPNEGSVIKELNIYPALEDGAGYVINIRETNNTTNSVKEVTVPLTSGEYFTIRRIGEFLMPYLLGIDLSMTP